MEHTEIATTALCLAACATDLRTSRIPNVLTFGATALAFGFHSLDGGQALAGSLVGWLVGFALFVPFAALGGRGGGDVKLLAAVGAWLGPWAVLGVALYSSLAGGVLALAVAFGHGYARQALANVVRLLRYWGQGGLRPLPDLTLAHRDALRLPYAVPIAVGLGVRLWLA